MRRLTKLLIAVIFICRGTFFIQEVQAEQLPAHPVVQADTLDLTGLGQSVPEEKLAWQNGRQDTQLDQLNLQISDLKSNGTVGGNTLNALNSTITTGLNSIGQNAFSNASGIVTVIQNSGNQVLIQNDMILNLWVK